jgi:hypothetical protein
VAVTTIVAGARRHQQMVRIAPQQCDRDDDQQVGERDERPETAHHADQLLGEHLLTLWLVTGRDGDHIDQVAARLCDDGASARCWERAGVGCHAGFVVQRPCGIVNFVNIARAC